MGDFTKKLAKISSARLEIQDRGIFGFYIDVNYEEGLSQVIGGIALDDYDKDKGCRIGTAYGCEMIRLLLLELCVNDFSEMKDKHIWVLGDGKGFHFKPLGVQSLSVDNSKTKPVIFSEVFERFTDKGTD